MPTVVLYQLDPLQLEFYVEGMRQHPTCIAGLLHEPDLRSESHDVRRFLRRRLASRELGRRHGDADANYPAAHTQRNYQL